MKQVVLRIDDAAYEKFMGMVSLCPMVEVVNVCQAKDARQMTDQFVASAIREMRQTRAFRYPCDYAFLMVAMNESVVKGLPFFIRPMTSWTICASLILTTCQGAPPFMIRLPK